MDLTIHLPDFVISPFLRIVLFYRKLRYGFPFIRIPLSQGKFAIIDPDDYREVSKYKWLFNKYALTIIVTNGKMRYLNMHKLIINVKPGLLIDHVNGNRLDNRKANLRPATSSQNRHNSVIRPHSSKFRGVYWCKREKKWHAQGCFNKKTFHLGYFKDETEAAKAYDQFAKKHFAHFANLNFPE